ncbi:MAG: hypothetical protein QOE70_6323 [Chthoniobacter sp.]|jgi:hypothetical protein|nr:hypothetical protein [Chthoniobacter sp.]
MNRKIVIGCAVVFIMFAILVGVAMVQLPRLFEKGKGWFLATLAEQQRIDKLEAAWKPPSPNVDATWFPAELGEWKLDRSAPIPGVPELDIPRGGYHASYSSSRGSVQVEVVAANDLEKETLLRRAQDALSKAADAEETTTRVGGVTVTSKNGSSRMTSSMGSRTHVQLKGDEHTRFWWVKGWLFIFRARGAADSETFPQKLLEATGFKAPAAPAR